MNTFKHVRHVLFIAVAIVCVGVGKDACCIIALTCHRVTEVKIVYCVPTAPAVVDNNTVVEMLLVKYKYIQVIFSVIPSGRQRRESQ